MGKRAGLRGQNVTLLSALRVRELGSSSDVVGNAKTEESEIC